MQGGGVGLRRRRRKEKKNNMWPDMNEQIALRKLLTGDKIAKLENLDIAACTSSVNGENS